MSWFAINTAVLLVRIFCKKSQMCICSWYTYLLDIGYKNFNIQITIFRDYQRIVHPSDATLALANPGIQLRWMASAVA